jgi:hypothetical protein
MRMSFHRKLRTFECLQVLFMPGIEAIKEVVEEVRDPDAAPPKAEDIKLWLPSEMSTEVRRLVCKRGVAEIEAKLHRTQCMDALDVLRSCLHAQRHLITWRNSNAVGQKASTQSATLIGQVGDRINRVAEKYRWAREALLELVGAASELQFKELLASDLNTNIAENDASA